MVDEWIEGDIVEGEGAYAGRGFVYAVSPTYVLILWHDAWESVHHREQMDGIRRIRRAAASAELVLRPENRAIGRIFGLIAWLAARGRCLT
jgi:hypothetical protein